MIPVSQGKPCAGNPHARFEEGVSAPESPRRNALLHKRQICVCTAVCAAAVAVGASFPLEWNGTYAMDVPYEVDVNTVKLARVAAAAPGGGFAVAATLPDGMRDLPVV